jgi:hypothetical protein
MTMNETDKLRLIGCPQELKEAVQNAVRTFWTYGIQHEQIKNGAYQFKLRGDPWRSNETETVMVRRLLDSTFSSLQTQGWTILVVGNLPSKPSPKTPTYPRKPLSLL